MTSFSSPPNNRLLTLLNLLPAPSTAEPAGVFRPAGSTAKTSTATADTSTKRASSTIGSHSFESNDNDRFPTSQTPPPPLASSPEDVELTDLSPRSDTAPSIPRESCDSQSRDSSDCRQNSSDSASSSTASIPLAPRPNYSSTDTTTSPYSKESDRLSRQVWREYW